MASETHDSANQNGSPTDVPTGFVPKYLNANTQLHYGIVVEKNVTPEKPRKLLKKETVLSDIQEQGVVNDFHSLRNEIKAIQGENILVIYDPEEKYTDSQLETEANFLVAISDEAMLVESESKTDDGEDETIEETIEEFEADLSKYVSLHEPEAKPWESLGSGQEVEDLSIKNTRPLLAVGLSRPRREFGTPVRFSDRDAHDSLYEYRPFKDPNFETGWIERDMAVQAIPQTCDSSAQTKWQRKVHIGMQYQPQSLSAEECDHVANSPQVSEFLTKTSTHYEVALEQNAVFDINKDDFADVVTDEAPIGTKADNTLREQNVFTDLEYSKSKQISSIDGMPQTSGVVAVSCTSRLSFAERIEDSGRVHPASVLIWNFLDPIHPQYVLTSPSDVMCFKFNPAQPATLVGGTITGQVVLWNLEQVVSEINRTASMGTEDGARKRDRNATVVPHTVVSSIASSHKASITDLSWLPAGLEIDNVGAMRRCSKGETQKQFATVSTDGIMNIWDTSFDKPLDEMNLTWTPSHSIPMRRPEESSLIQIQQLVLGEADFLLSTQDGEIARGDFREGGTIRKIVGGHRGAIPALERSPFLRSVYLSAGDWTFSLWRDGIQSPLLVSPFASAFLTCLKWSPIRPAVFFVGRADGGVDVWDLADQSHEPSLSQQVSSSSVTSMDFVRAAGSRVESYVLMVGDDQGVVHAMTIPRNLARTIPQEKTRVEHFITREIDRVKKVSEGQTKAPAISIPDLQKEEKTDDDETRAAVEADRKEEHEAEQREAEYRALEAAFRKKFGLSVVSEPAAE